MFESSLNYDLYFIEMASRWLASGLHVLYCRCMVIVRFDNADEERRALGWLAGRFSFRTWENGDFMLHEATLPYLAREGIPFRVQGPATYEHFRPTIRDTAPASV